MARIILSFFVIILSIYLTEQTYFLKQEYIDNINHVASTWKAGMNFDPDTSEEYLTGLLGSKGVVRDVSKIKSRLKTHDSAYKTNMKIPKYFDSRLFWRHCTTIGEVRDQGNCGSCWAFGTTGAFADRLCIATNGEFNQLISAEELAFCCHLCGNGCNGGYPIKAWTYFKYHGIVSGGNYNTTDGCQPYKISPCLHHEEGETACDKRPMAKNQKCIKTCYGDNSLDYSNDHKYTRDAYNLAYETIQKDIIAYGPIEASFDVYDDFFNYKSGVYVKSENATYKGGHAVKLIGWGVEHGVDYWLLVNSWGYKWGNNGLFKIRRGTNECEIDDSTTGGVPVV
ncbi:Cysteine peptidase, cysteine active site,Peptidase C1A, papain C-terminal,Peptidase C1A [Cinara cedri]|uniref:Cysteine peptidase, cysteine active site,Peptidase C1A, papain C-terminal,Peptidase C1A n=1 Tax=Cinara cedri TaxID=506608 RepID=A0A5E4M446_9HEMI|nr:Cysteine peptidase, cysteine active site,Peptidase C1A, papain C-terminal,Peptidase C1A [Cinara cedri]